MADYRPRRSEPSPPASATRVFYQDSDDHEATEFYAAHLVAMVAWSALALFTES